MYDSVTVEIIDNVSLHAYDTIMVNYMDTPIIEIIYPDYVSHDTTYANIIVSGTTYNTSAGDTVEIYLNGILQSDSMQLSDLSGTWSLSLDLLGLGDSATVKLTDQFGRIAWDTILINYFSNVPPYCTMISLVSGETYGLNVSCTFVIYDTNNENCTLTAVQYSVDSGMTWIDASIDSGNWTNIYADTDGETYVFIWMSYTDLPDTIIYPVQFRIIPFDNIDTGLADTIINFCIDNLQPDTPTGLIAIADVDIPDTGVILSWTEVIDSNLQGYNIYIDTGNGYTKINTSIVTDTEYFDSILAVQGDTQYYVVTAVDIYGNESGYSDSAGASHFVLYKELYSVMIGSDSKNVIPGATLEYRIYYLNNGFAPCDSMILYDTFPSVNTDLIDSGIISGFVPLIEFSNDNQSTWSYVPILVPVDVNITDLRFRFIQSIPPQLTGWSGVLYYKTVVK
jgi:hypothetical protein